ncbi:MAG: T9SS type A sorting domain-containing protein [Chitinophagaceae bacterium]|nr:T9SS type A sorting domain-containing protein [Chitinophagaceae bacterium]
MKKALLLAATLAAVIYTKAQNELYNNGAGLYIASGGVLSVNGSFTNTGTGASLQNNGTLRITGNIVNDQTMSAYTGLLVFNGNAIQTLYGAAGMLTRDLEINNPAGVILNAALKVDHSAAFTNGIITAAATTAPLWFRTSATHTGAANAAHVNGYVVKEGAGNFDYPVGDGARYQRVRVNASSNTGGIRVRYIPGDAGDAPFSATGASSVPLLYHNAREYWDISPLSAAAGTVTIYWDDYNNSGITSRNHLTVAHKRGGNWLNEGAASVSGTATAGSVTSASINAWSPFTLGSINSLSTLPVSWLQLSGSLNAAQQALISWQVNESNVADYQVEKSADGRQFTTVGQLNSKGDGSNSYSFTEADRLTANAYYRIRQTDMDGRHAYSPIIRLQGSEAINDRITVYPMPFTTGFTVTSDKAQKAYLINTRGQTMQQMQLSAGANFISAARLLSGVYYLIAENGHTLQLVKQ